MRVLRAGWVVLVFLPFGWSPAAGQDARMALLLQAGDARPQSLLNGAGTARLRPGTDLTLGVRWAVDEDLGVRLDVSWMPTRVLSASSNDGVRVDQFFSGVGLDYEYLRWRRVTLSLFGGAGLAAIHERGPAPATHYTPFYPLSLGARYQLAPRVGMMAQVGLQGYRISNFPSGSALGAYGRNQSTLTYAAGLSIGLGRLVTSGGPRSPRSPEDGE
jgi:hypothetical protein